MGLAVLVTGLFLSACGGGGNSQASASNITVANRQPGVTPFIASLQLSGPGFENVVVIQYTIAPKPRSVSKPVQVQYSIDSLIRRGYATKGGNSATLPVFGLYAGYLNEVSIKLTYVDSSSKVVTTSISTASYSDPNQIYDQPTILVGRTATSALGFDFMYLKSFLGSPIVIDTDAQIRWVGPNVGSSGSSTFNGSSFVIGSANSTGFTQMELDGVTHSLALRSSAATSFHHDIDPGKSGLFANVNAGPNGVESMVVEMNMAGAAIAQWDLAATLYAHMLDQGDDPTLFVRPGKDWFHMNSATYDPSDDSVVVSSRENFVIKIDYRTGNIKWILGDPTKYWYTFASLRAKALKLDAGDLPPIGQHALSINSDGQLMLFNNGFASAFQPAGEQAGTTRTYSAVSAYTIDPVAMTASEAWRFDYGKTIYSAICSSAYEAQGKTMLIDYAYADAGTHTRLVGLDAAHQVVFDFQYPDKGCNTSWNALPIQFENLIFQ